MMLSKLVAFAANRDMARALGDPHRLHALLLRAFEPVADPDARRAHGILHRCDASPDGTTTILVQSRSVPDWGKLPRECFVEVRGPKSIDDSLRGIREGDVFHFRLRANVTRKIDTKSVGDVPRNGRRVPLRDDTSRAAWLARKGERHGFVLERDPFGDLDLRISREGTDRAFKKGQAMTFDAVRFDGRLRVTNVPAFVAGVEQGIGPAKAFGFGLLSIARG